MRIHPVFHVSLLEPTITAPDTIRKQPEVPPPIVIDNELEYEVESILASRRSSGTTQYLVHWKGYPISERTWQTEHDLQHAKQLLDAFKARHKPGKT